MSWGAPDANLRGLATTQKNLGGCVVRNIFVGTLVVTVYKTKRVWSMYWLISKVTGWTPFDHSVSGLNFRAAVKINTYPTTCVLPIKKLLLIKLHHMVCMKLRPKWFIDEANVFSDSCKPALIWKHTHGLGKTNEVYLKSSKWCQEQEKKVSFSLSKIHLSSVMESNHIECGLSLCKQRNSFVDEHRT